MFAQAFSLRFRSPRRAGIYAAFAEWLEHGSKTQGLFGARSAGGVAKWDFSLPTFVRPGDQPEVLRFLLEFLFADRLGLYQMKYPCRGKRRASDSATLNLRLSLVWMHTSLSPPEMQKGDCLHWMPRGPGSVQDLLPPKPGGGLGVNPGLAKDQEKSHLKTVTAR